jgi:hypothetical protein
MASIPQSFAKQVDETQNVWVWRRMIEPSNGGESSRLLRLDWKAKSIEHSAKRKTKENLSHEFFAFALCSLAHALCLT